MTRGLPAMPARVSVGATSATVNAMAGNRPHGLSAALASVLNAFMAALSVKMPTTCRRGFGVPLLPPCSSTSLRTMSRRLSVAARSPGTFTRSFALQTMM